MLSHLTSWVNLFGRLGGILVTITVNAAKIKRHMGRFRGTPRSQTHVGSHMNHMTWPIHPGTVRAPDRQRISPRSQWQINRRHTWETQGSLGVFLSSAACDSIWCRLEEQKSLHPSRLHVVCASTAVISASWSESTGILGMMLHVSITRQCLSTLRVWHAEVLSRWWMTYLLMAEK